MGSEEEEREEGAKRKREARGARESKSGGREGREGEKRRREEEERRASEKGSQHLSTSRRRACYRTSHSKMYTEGVLETIGIKHFNKKTSEAIIGWQKER